MKISRITIRIIATIEILIGACIFVSYLFGVRRGDYPANHIGMMIFIIISSGITLLIGVGLLRYKNWARRILIFFAGYVAFTKFLLLTNVVVFSGDTIEFMPLPAKNTLSFIYHLAILAVFNLKAIKKELS